jgi:hypothetical protein
VVASHLLLRVLVHLLGLEQFAPRMLLLPSAAAAGFTATTPRTWKAGRVWLRDEVVQRSGGGGAAQGTWQM